MIITFLFQIDYTNISDNIFGMIAPKEKTTFSELTYTQVLKRVETCWNTCDEFTTKSTCGNFMLLKEGLTSEQETEGLDADFFTNKFSSLNFCSDCKVSINPDLNLKPNTISKMFCDYNLTNTPIKVVRISN